MELMVLTSVSLASFKNGDLRISPFAEARAGTGRVGGPGACSHSHKSDASSLLCPDNGFFQHYQGFVF